MKNFFRNLGAKAQRWMSGRYGYDELSRAMSTIALIFLLLACVPELKYLYVPALLLWIISLFRCYSRNLEKRRNERSAYLCVIGRIKGWFALKKRAWKDRKTHRYIRCKQCKAVLRVPKGKGKLQVTCNRCHNTIIIKT